MEKDPGKGGKIVFIDTPILILSRQYTEKQKTFENRTTQKVSYSVYMPFRCLKDNIYKTFRTVPRAY